MKSNNIHWTADERATVYNEAARLLGESQGAISSRELFLTAQSQLPETRRRPAYNSAIYQFTKAFKVARKTSVPAVKQFTPEAKAEAVRRVRGGESVKDVARSVGVSKPSLYGWLAKKPARKAYPNAVALIPKPKAQPVIEQPLSTSRAKRLQPLAMEAKKLCDYGRETRDTVFQDIGADVLSLIIQAL